MTVDTRTGVITDRLTAVEASQRESLEHVVERGLGTFVEVGQALAQINSARLYRSTHATFAEYAADRFGIGRSQAYRLIDAAKVAAAVSPIGDIANEAQARALVGLTDDEAQEVYQIAQGLSATQRGTVNPSAADLTDARRGLHHPPAITPAPSPIGPEWDTAVEMATEDVVDAEIVEDEPTPPTPITGRDGKTYPRPVPAPRPENRRALGDVFRDKTTDLLKITKALTDLAADDRFARNREQVAARNGNDLRRAIDALTGVAEQLN